MNRYWDEVPEELRKGWQETTAGAAWRELLGHVPRDVLGLPTDLDLGDPDEYEVLGDAAQMCAADNAFTFGVDLAELSTVDTPILQMLTSTYWLSEIEGDGDHLMFHCPANGETADTVVLHHETGYFSRPIAHDLPTTIRVLDVERSAASVEERAEQLKPTLGRWRADEFPFNYFSFQSDGIWDGKAIEYEFPASAMPDLADRSR